MSATWLSPRLPVSQGPADHQDSPGASEFLRGESSFLAHSCLFMKRTGNCFLPDIKMKLVKGLLVKGKAQIMSFNPKKKCPQMPRKGGLYCQELLSRRQGQTGARVSPAGGLAGAGPARSCFHSSSITHWPQDLGPATEAPAHGFLPDSHHFCCFPAINPNLAIPGDAGTLTAPSAERHLQHG